DQPGQQEDVPDPAVAPVLLRALVSFLGRESPAALRSTQGGQLSDRAHQVTPARVLASSMLALSPSKRTDPVGNRSPARSVNDARGGSVKPTPASGCPGSPGCGTWAVRCQPRVTGLMTDRGRERRWAGRRRTDGPGRRTSRSPATGPVGRSPATAGPGTPSRRRPSARPGSWRSAARPRTG